MARIGAAHFLAITTQSGNAQQGHQARPGLARGIAGARISSLSRHAGGSDTVRTVAPHGLEHATR